jgi:hypothetical protein
MVTRSYPYHLALYMFIYDRVSSLDRDRSSFDDWFTRARFLQRIDK